MTKKQPSITIIYWVITLVKYIVSVLGAIWVIASIVGVILSQNTLAPSDPLPAWNMFRIFYGS